MSRHTVFFLSLLGVLAVAALPAEAQAVIWVDDDTCPLVGSGSQANPYCKIQSAYDVAADGDEIRVLEGIYNDCVFAFDLVSQKGVSLIADAFDPLDPATRALTTIDGNGLQCRFAPIPPATVGAPAGVLNLGGFGSRVEGFTITRGTLGGGILATGPVTITNNVIDSNMSPEGGGLLLYPSPCYYGNVVAVVSDNDITNNTAVAESTFLSGQGGGIFVNGLAGNPLATTCLVGGDLEVQIQDNVIADNTSDGSGGGIGGFTQTDAQGLSAHVVITGNTIDTNTATGNTLPPAPNEAYPGGLGGGIYMTTYGYGTETIEITQNTVRGNETTIDFGGGVSAAVLTYNLGTHSVTVSDNTVTGNTAGTAGGGLDLFQQMIDFPSPQSASLVAENNTVTGNTSLADWGGGILVTIDASRSSTPNQTFRLAGNRVRSNNSGLFGGGIAVDMFADADPLDTPSEILPADATLELANNLVAGNTAATGSQGGTGGGVFVFVGAKGDATATVDMPLNTIASNAIDDPAGSGGVEIEPLTLQDTGGNEGFTSFTLNSSIVYDNDGLGVGGPDPGLGPGTANSATEVVYTNIFNNLGGDLAAWIQEPGGTNQFVNPQLDAATFAPMACSPTLDAGDPALDFLAETPPNGGRVNLGNTGGTANSTPSLADVNGNGIVDGVDVVRLSVAFGAGPAQPRFDPAADFDSNDQVDGTDLAYLSGDFGDVCP